MSFNDERKLKITFGWMCWRGMGEKERKGHGLTEDWKERSSSFPPLYLRKEPRTLPLLCAHRRCEQLGARARDITAESRAGCAFGLSRGRAPGAGGPCPVPRLAVVQGWEPRSYLAARFSPFPPWLRAARSPWTAT